MFLWEEGPQSFRRQSLSIPHNRTRCPHHSFPCQCGYSNWSTCHCTLPIQGRKICLKGTHCPHGSLTCQCGYSSLSTCHCTLLIQGHKICLKGHRHWHWLPISPIAPASLPRYWRRGRYQNGSFEVEDCAHLCLEFLCSERMAPSCHAG